MSIEPATVRSVGKAAAALFHLVIDAVIPPRCLGCESIVETQGVLCADCWSRATFLAPPWCAVCGLPFPFDPGAGFLCADCIRARPPFARARAALAYDDGSRGMILAFKHADRTDAATAFAAWMRRAAADLVADAEIIVPVPLHWTRLFRRRYNQAALLAHALGRDAAAEVVPDALVRTRRTPSQGTQSREGRFRNVQGAFAIHPHRRDLIAGRRVLLVDDVMTVGATASACARVLVRAGAPAVDVLTLARVVRTGG